MAPIPHEKRAETAQKRLNKLKRLMASCRLCPRECKALRFKGETGECGLDNRLLVSSSHLHPGEEPVLSGWIGSGTIFFSGCNLSCLFCQNYPISQLHAGKAETAVRVAQRMLELEYAGAHNINLVTPTPQLTGIVEALILAWDQGLKIPIVYNCGGYEGVEALRLLDGLVDIYLTDLKYGADEAGVVSDIDDYFTHASQALKEMHRQVGVLVTDPNGIASSGVIVRHLVLPSNQSASEKALRFIAEEVDRNTYISLMSQYFPSHRARENDRLCYRLTAVEYELAVQAMRKFGLENGWVQPSP